MYEFKTILTNLLARASVALPLKSQIQISTSSSKKNLSLSLPIFAPFGIVPKNVSEYVLKRNGIRFKPHSTRFEENEGKIYLIQEISFLEEGQDSLRNHVVHFWNLALRCHKMLKEIALEEKMPKLASFDFVE